MGKKSSFRPWGKIDWLFAKLPITQWDYIGCLSTERRCLTAFLNLKNKKVLARKVFMEIKDPNESTIHHELRDKNRSYLTSLGENVEIEEHSLLQPLDKIFKSIQSFLSHSSGNVVLDISAFPKRFFFPLLRFSLENKKVNNLTICYSSPKSYSESNLSDNPQPWNTIPGFRSRNEDGTEIAIIGLGFMPLGLPDVLGGDGHKKKQMFLFFPFPPGPPFYQRTWNFVKEISEYRPIQTKDLIRIDAKNVPEVFDKICAISEGGNRKVLFAPFGPKTFSLAMCLHACQSDSSVYYTQPMYYSPNYSEGEGEVYSYCIVLNGKNLYEI